MPGGTDKKKVSFMLLQYRVLQVLTSGWETVMTGPLLIVEFSNIVVRKKMLCFHTDKVAGAVVCLY